MRQRKPDDVLDLLTARKGHFLLESGHHGDLWLDLERLCIYPKLIQPLCAELAGRLSLFNMEVVCSPLVEGAFVGLFVASELGLTFSYTERFVRSNPDGLFPAGYRLPDSLRCVVQGKQVVIVNDVINAGSAVRGTFEELERCGAEVVAIGALLTLGGAAQELADARNVVLESLAHLPNSLWSAPTCPLCLRGVPLEDVAGFRQALGNSTVP
ncbi:MAG: hypothetical protein JOZ45_19845 [Acidobacteriaceae bacterium]|nr:hypothetical protein [Acidobacteriaceae bacterium]MBV9308407.1 hypothetical protein [Acidobacteriaceae bacterium]